MEKLPSGQRVVFIIEIMSFIQKHKRFGCTTFDDLYLDKIIYNKPLDCTIVNVEPSISLKQEELEKRADLHLVPGKNMNPMIFIKFQTGT